jgi:hypothetical protein
MHIFLNWFWFLILLCIQKSVSLIVRALSEHTTGPMELQLKILQTILPLLTNYTFIHGDVIADVMSMFFLQKYRANQLMN